MKTLLTSICFVCTLAIVHSEEPLDNAVTDSAEASAEVNIAKSSFIDEFGNGVDPFFPRSERRKARIVKTISTTPTNVTSAALNSLELKGISGTADRKVALISGRTFVVGEIVEMRFPEGYAKVRCDSINSETNSVVVSLVGKPLSKEIFLNDEMLRLN